MTDNIQNLAKVYGEEIESVTEKVMDGIAKFANTSGKVIIYVSNGHGAWEASLVNLFRPGDKVLLCSTGHFGHKWGLIAKRLGLDLIHLESLTSFLLSFEHHYHHHL